MTTLKLVGDRNCKTCHGEGEYREAHEPWLVETMACECLMPADGSPWPEDGDATEWEIQPAPEWVEEQAALDQAEGEFVSSWQPAEDEHDWEPEPTGQQNSAAGVLSPTMGWENWGV